MRTRMLLLAAAVLLAVPACGDDGNGAPAITPSSSATTTATPSTATTTTRPATTTTPATTAATTTTAVSPTTPTSTTAPTTAVPSRDVRVYLVRNDLLAIGHRLVPAATPLRGALEALLAGPTAEEAALGYATTIPAGTTLLGVDIEDTTAVVDLSGTYDDGGGTRSMQLRLAEVVFTATQFPNVSTVVFRLDGIPTTGWFSSEGLELTGPVSRSAYRDTTSGVLVDAPLPDGGVTSPVVIRGESDSYEANFMVDVWSGGTLLSSQGYQAGGAWGDWEDFEITVPVDAPAGPIVIDLYDEGGCGTDPECPPITHNPLPLQLTA